ncbi:helix-turn-helix transcriptional regulator [Oceaniglobus trochenteri]|uniref:helix-turn-helix transcriptional regulator n=1 Tax=Oceaniglobus trochenteri TaxID=2763260 RepID=UPI001CFF6B02|nr:helix-turn-helix domain-containing protein [Oceaniglobus trochenteri]
MQFRTFTINSYIGAQESFHFARKELDARWPAYSHDHDYYELFLVEQGMARHRINGRTETLPRGSLVFIRPSDTHGFQASAEYGCQIINVIFRTETADHLFARYGEELGRRFFWVEGPQPDTFLLSGPRLERAINSSAEMQTARRTLARIEQFLLYLMTRVIDYAIILPEGTPRWLVTACQAARTPRVFRRGAAGFVEAAGRGHEHVCRTTRKHLGVSPSAYVNRIRMEHAAMHLGSSDRPILDISLDCGIENLSHFYKLFRDVYGNTPSQYRKFHRVDPVQPG